jgi:hypothetical protein
VIRIGYCSYNNQPAQDEFRELGTEHPAMQPNG